MSESSPEEPVEENIIKYTIRKIRTEMMSHITSNIELFNMAISPEYGYLDAIWEKIMPYYIDEWRDYYLFFGG